MEFHIYKNKETLCDELAVWMSNLISDVLQSQEYFTLALSGGETPKLLFSKLASEKFINKINWKRIHIFWGDERVVPFTDKRNNAAKAFEILLNHVDIPSAQVHIMRTDIEPVFAAKEYEKVLHPYFNNTIKSFDLVLLGMGDDGHTLSLFPHSPVIEEHDNWVNAVYNEEQQMYRITLMPLIVNKAQQIAFLVSGKNKANALKEVLKGKYNPEVFPSQLITPENGHLHWFLDEDAASSINSA